MRDRASEREKFYIQAHYYDEVTLDLEKTLAVYAEWRATYPRDTAPYDNAALVYGAFGQYDKALDLASQSMRMDPKDAYAYDNMASAYEALNRFDEARSIGEQAVAQKWMGRHVPVVFRSRLHSRRLGCTIIRQTCGAAQPTNLSCFFSRASGDGSGKSESLSRDLASGPAEGSQRGNKEFAGRVRRSKPPTKSASEIRRTRGNA